MTNTRVRYIIVATCTQATAGRTMYWSDFEETLWHYNRGHAKRMSKAKAVRLADYINATDTTVQDAAVVAE